MWMFLQSGSSVLFSLYTRDANGDVCVLWAVRLYRLTERQSKYPEGSLAAVLGCSFISDSLRKNDFAWYSALPGITGQCYKSWCKILSGLTVF